MPTESIGSFLEQLKALDVRVWLDGEQLRVSAPAGVLDDQLKEALRSRKQQLRDALGARAIAQATATPNEAPLSFAQQRIWFFQQLQPESSAYNLGAILALNGPLDRAALDASVSAIVQRHEILRTTYTETDGEPRMVLHDAPASAIPMIDLTTVGAGRDGEAASIWRAEQTTPFDLEKDFPLRATLIRLSEHEHQLVLTFHHIAADGTSLLLFARELAAHYVAATVRQSAALPPLAVQYAELARQERQWISSPAYAETLAYWKERLAGDLTPLALPLDHPRPAIQTFRGEVVHAMLPASLAEALRVLSRRHGATLPMTLLTAFNAVLHRHTGDADLLVGLPVANRDRAEARDPIGMFVNTVVVRTDAGGNPAFGELLGRVKGAMLGALAHQEIPFARLVDELHPQRDLSRTPLFQVMFNMFTAEVEPAIAAGALTITAPPAERVQAALETEAKFDLTMYVHESPDGIRCTLAYNADLFDRARMERLVAHFVRFAEAAVRDAGVRIGDVVLEPPAPREIVHTLRPGLFTPVGEEFERSTIATRFKEIVARHAHRPAVVTGDATWTYEELQRHAGGVAAAVHGALGGKSSRVALLAGRGAPMIAAVLGVIEQGSAYVPLDPSFPAARLTALMADAGADVILAEPEFAALATAAGEGRRVIVIGDDAGTADSPPAPHDPDAHVYVLYTSGSSGRPKGVAQTHRNVLAYIRAYINALELTPHDRMTLIASYTFDASVVDIFSALLSGAALYPLDVRLRGAHEIAQTIDAADVTVYHSTPTYFRALVPHLNADAHPSVRCVVLGGEKVFAADVAAFAQRFTENAVFVNLYGATEASIALLGMFARASMPHGQSVAVGAPIPGVEVQLVDEHGAPASVRGEIVLRGRAVASGYWNAPDLTAAAFTADDSTGVRTYRTGDLALRRPDGSYEVLGRRDAQIKIRGLRIEPGEIEMVLAAHPHVQQCVVVADQSVAERPTLLAFAALDRPNAASVAELHEYLSRILPEYMVPSAILLLDRLPLTRTGKVDRRALPTAGELGLHAAQEHVGPRDAVEEMLASVWADVLQRERIGVHDNFFALGGHSLNATQVIARVRGITGVELPLRTLFTAPTVEGMAAAMRHLQTAADPAAPALRARPETEVDAPLAFSQERMWYLQQLIPDGTAYNITNGSLVTGHWDRDAFLVALSDVVARHQMLRTTFIAPHGEPRQQVHPTPDALPVIEQDFTHLPPEERLAAARAFAADIAMRPFDLENGPLWWLVIARVREDQHVIVLSMHHIISDLWSIGVFGRDLDHAYRTRLAGSPTALPPLELNYTDFAHWQREWLSGDRLRGQLEYWMNALQGLAPLELPIDRPRAPIQTARGSRRRHEITGDVVHRVRALAVREGATPFMVLFAAFNALLYRYTGQTDIGIGVPIANRTHVGLEGIVGTFVNTLVHRNDLSGTPSFRELLRRVRTVALEAYAHQDLPFERLVRELAPERDASRSPVFQVLFNLANAPVVAEQTSGITITPLEIERLSAQFELTLVAHLGEKIQLAAGFNSDLFDASTVERLLLNYTELLAAAVRAPDRSITELAVMPEAERAAIIDGINATVVPLPDTTVVSAVDGAAAANPGAPAIVFEGESTTYRDLVARANRLARDLQASGVAPGDLVGLCVARTPDLVVALLAVMKAGAAYVPIDPNFPAQRVAFMLEDSRARIVITDSASRGALGEHQGNVVLLDERFAGAARETDVAPAVNVSPDAVAYVIYTSGSTGKPKGVEVTHRSLMNFLLSMQQCPGIRPEDALLAVTTISFDIAGLELYLPLITGAAIVLAPREVATDAPSLLKMLRDTRPSIMQATPATWRALVDAGWQSGDTPQLVALCGGEALGRDLAASLLPRVKALWNMYGPTETTIWSTVHHVTDASRTIPVGRPIANTRVYVLDPNLQPVPRGVAGELFIGGDGVARGYLNRPEMTAERFVSDPFASVPAARMYRTGDKARMLEDGNIEHLGRLDDQVKLRGYRIELGEIEAAVSASPVVKQCAVAVRQDRLTAFVVFEPGHELTATEVRRFLREALPEYMVPSLVVTMDALPMTPNGKVDRKALPDPLRSVRDANDYNPPTTVTEVLVANVWRDLLAIERVSTTDNFFELGGHSLLSIRAVHEIQQRTGWRPDARAFFFQTLGQIAASRPDSES